MEHDYKDTITKHDAAYNMEGDDLAAARGCLVWGPIFGFIFWLITWLILGWFVVFDKLPELGGMGQ